MTMRRSAKPNGISNPNMVSRINHIIANTAPYCVTMNVLLYMSRTVKPRREISGAVVTYSSLDSFKMR